MTSNQRSRKRSQIKLQVRAEWRRLRELWSQATPTSGANWRASLWILIHLRHLQKAYVSNWRSTSIQISRTAKNSFEAACLNCSAQARHGPSLQIQSSRRRKACRGNVRQPSAASRLVPPRPQQSPKRSVRARRREATSGHPRQPPRLRPQPRPPGLHR